MDTNDDSSVNIADAITILSYLFNKQPMKGPNGTPLLPADAGCRIWPAADVTLPCASPNCAP